MRSQTGRHSLQLEDIGHKRGRLDIMGLSVFGLIFVYNSLPADTVAMKDVTEFQRALQDLVKQAALDMNARWKKLLSPRWGRWQHPLIHDC